MRDVALAFGMAAALDFRVSDSFPSQDLLRRGKRETGSHNLVLLNKFKEWIASSREDASFKYYNQMFNFFGPLQYLYEDAIKFGHGLGREAAWMLIHPLFAQGNKRNYHTEAMVHIVNFVAAWPRATRELLQHNCSEPKWQKWPQHCFRRVGGELCCATDEELCHRLVFFFFF